jgi:hypothetical protein
MAEGQDTGKLIISWESRSRESEGGTRVRSALLGHIPSDLPPPTMSKSESVYHLPILTNPSMIGPLMKPGPSWSNHLPIVLLGGLKHSAHESFVGTLHIQIITMALVSVSFLHEVVWQGARSLRRNRVTRNTYLLLLRLELDYVFLSQSQKLKGSHRVHLLF